MINPYSKINNARNLTHGTNIDYRGNEQTTINTNNPPKQANEQGWLVRTLGTVGDFVTNIVQGAVKSIEGIVDAGAMIGGLFGADVDEFVSYDFTSDIFGTDEEGEGLLDWSWGKALSDVSYLEDDSMVNQIAEGVGGMLPAIAVNFIPGVGSALSKMAFIGGAIGNASEQALQEGATYGQALGYGATAGVIEGATEMIGGRAIGKATELTDTALGKLLIRKGLDKGVSQGAGKLAYTFVSEGVEEVLSDIADPINKRVWGVSDTFEMPTLKDLGKTFFVGGSVGAVLDGVGKGASAIRNRSKGGKSFVKVADNLEDISNTTKALAYLQQTKGVSQERFDSATVRSSERMMDSIENISEALQSMTEEQRKSAFETLRESTSFVDDTFNSDGTIKEEVKESYADVMNFGAKYNVSSNLVYRGKEIENDIKAVNEQKDVNLELSDSKFTENQRKSFAKINRSLAKLNSKVGEKLSIIAIKDNADKVNAFIDGNNIYINEKYLEDGKWARYLSHEVSHFAKKSKEFNAFAEYITKYTEENKLNELVLQIDENYKYNLTLDGAKEIIGKVQKGEQVSKKESDFYDELVAHITEDLFTNEESINTLVKDNSGLAKKILNRIKQFLQIFKGTNADTQTVVDLRKAEMLFEKALSSIGKENEELTKKYEKGVAEYKKAKETYNKLPENQREKWLKENNWQAEDFADDVMGYDEELDNEKETSNISVTESKDIRFSKSKTFSEQVDDVINRKHNPNYDLYVSETPKVFLDIGFENKPLLMRNSKVNDILAKHPEISAELIKKIPQAISDPVMIVKSKTNPTESVVAITDIKTSKGEMIIPVWINQDGTYLDVELGNSIRLNTNFVASAYGRSTKSLIEYAIENNEVLFYAKDKKRVSTLLATHGLQLPARLSTTNFTNIILKSNKNVNSNLQEIDQKNLKTDKNKEVGFSKGSSDGLYQKKIADISKKKVYAKKEAEEVIKTVIGRINLGNGYYVDVTTKKSVEGVIDELWKVMNTNDAGKRVKASEDITDYLIDTLVIKDMFENEDYSNEINTISAIRPYLHNIDLSAIKDEIKYHFDKDNSVYAIWGAKKGEKGKSADQIAMELEESGIYIKAENQAEIFFEIDRMYRDALKTINEKKVDYLKDNLNEEDRKQLRTKIRNEILRSFDEYGSKSKFTKVIEEQAVWRELYYRERAVGKLLYEVDALKKVKEFQSASEFNNEQFKGSIEKLGKLNWRGNLNESGARKIASTLLGWYNEENTIIGKRFDKEVYNTLDEISKGNGKLVSNEIRNLSNVVAYFRKFVETYSKVYREGKWVEAKPLVEDYVKKLEDSKNIKVGWLSTMADKVFNNKRWSYAEAFNDPMTLARYMDKYGDGFFTQMMENFREGAVKSAIEELELKAPIEEFSQEHKKYFKELSKRIVVYQGVEMTMDKAISLYMTLNRGHALLGLARSGFAFENEDGKIVRVDGFATDETLTFDEIQQRAFGVQEELGRQFNDIDFEYIEILEDIFNVKAKKLKAERDREMRGYTNVTDDYYFPIIRSNIAKGIESLPNFITDSISNASFNKNIVKGTQSELFINSIDLITEKHIKGIAQYYHLAQAIQTYDVLFNLDISGNKNKPITVKTESANVWKNGEQYFKTMLEDIQGKKKGDSGLYSFIRKGFAKFQLGANPKVWFTQLSSFFASTSILDYRSVVKGLAIKGDDVDKYCKLAWVRNSDNTVAKSQGLVEEVGKVGDFLMLPIGKEDRFVITKLFGACQVQVAKENGLKVGTEENKVKAGELLQKVILETQQNSMATEKSQAMRSSSEFMKTLTMFTSDAMKVVGRVIDSFGKCSVIKARIRMTTDSKALETLKKELKSARKQAVKSTGALVTQAMFMALIAEAFKYFYNRDEEDEEIVEEILVDTVGNLFGGLPILKDVLGKLTQGYDFDSFAFSSIDDLLSAVSGLTDLVGDIINGKADSREVASNLRKISYALGQIFGIPVRNIYNVFYGTSNLVSPSFAYKLSDTFSKQKYSSDLKRAIAREDDQMIATIVGLMTDENVGYFENSSTRQEINRLVKADFDVLPQSIANTMTINETQYTLNETQKDEFRKVYEKSITAIDKLVSSNGYKIVSDDVKAKAIKYVYRYYYYESQSETLDVELDNKLFLFGQLIPIDKMALILAEAPSIAEKSTDKKKAVQRYLQSTKLSAIQKYMLMGYFGYKNTNSESAVKSAIDKTSLTKAQKKLLLEKCGY